MENEVQDVAMALHRASQELRGGSAQEHTLGTIASSLVDASDPIRDNPVLFLGGAALLGFVVSRCAKASGRQSVATATRQKAEYNAQVDTFVHEGNPNVQPVSAAP